MKYEKLTITQLLERLGEAIHRANLLAVEAERAHEHTKRVLSRLIRDSALKGTQQAEHAARASDDYEQAMDAEFEVKREAAKAKAQAEHLRIRWETYRTMSADRRIK